MDYPKRKHNRLKNFDYRTATAYFITLCTADRKNILWQNPEKNAKEPQDIQLTKFGCVVLQSITEIKNHYPAVTVDHFVIMPNHVHLLLQIHTNKAHQSDKPFAMPSDSNNQTVKVLPKVSIIIQQMKGSVSKQIGTPIWQKGFYDHIIRSINDYNEIWNYIDNNPKQWLLDEHYHA